MLMEELRNPHPGEKALEIARKNSRAFRKKCHWTKLKRGLLKCCQITATPLKTKMLLIHAQKNSQGLCHRCHPSWIKETRTSRHADGKFQKHCNGNVRRVGEESPFFDCWDWRHEQCDIVCSKRTLENKMYRCLNPLRILPQTINFCQLQLPSTTSVVREDVDLTKYQSSRSM